MNSKISCWRFVRSLGRSIGSGSSVSVCLMEQTCVRDTSATRRRTQDRRAKPRGEMFASGPSPLPARLRTLGAMAVGAATDRAAGAPLSYLGGRSFVDDRALLLELFTAVLEASEG